MTKYIIPIVILSILVAYTSAEKPLCIGSGNVPSIKDPCRKITNRTECLTTKSISTNQVSGSCYWHQLRGNKILETQMVASYGGPLVSSGFTYTGSLCGLKVSVAIPTTSNGTWGANFRIIGGPADFDDGSNLVASPKVPLTSATCVVGRGAGPSCTAELVAPEGYARTSSFKNNTVIISFFTTDSKRISQWRRSKVLTKSQALVFKTKYEYLRCTKPPYPGNDTGISDKVVFGPTSYQMLPVNEAQNPTGVAGGYSMVTYRSYRLTNVTAAEWDARVVQSLEANGEKTPLSVMLLTELDYLKWYKRCNTTCVPPKELALQGSICEAKTCSGNRTNLVESHAYRLLVSYQSKIYGLKYDRSFSEYTPISDKELNKQIVKVIVKPQWGLAAPGSINPSNTPAPAPAQTTTQKKAGILTDDDDDSAALLSGQLNSLND